MAVLTRIKNNQITDSTILANTKIVPGSIVGSLFNSNLTITSDVTITGNLTVQGSGTYLTIASTNTYINDPLILLNNAFTGTNTYDIGLLINRGDQPTTAIYWHEGQDEFRLTYTTETGSLYGQINNSGYANLRVGNLNVEGIANISSISLTGNISADGLTLSGDLAVNGGDITSTASTFNLLDANVTTLNFAGATTSLDIGANTGTVSINNANIWYPNATTIGSGQASLDLFTATVTSANLLTNATTLSIGGTTGNLIINNPTVVGTSASQDLFNTGATTLNIGGDATSISLGETTGVLSLNNANIWMPNATAVHSGQASVSLFNDFTTTLNFANAATVINIGASTGTLTVKNPTLVGTATTQNLFNTTATTINFAGAATALTMAATTGTTTIQNNLDVDLSLNARDINNTVIGNVTPQAGTFTNLTSTDTTILGLTSATAINNTPIGNATPSTGAFTTLLASGITEVTDTTTAPSLGTGAFRVAGGASVSGNLWVGGNINVVGNTYVISGNTGQFFGDLNGFGALYAGITGFTVLPQTVTQFAADANDYAQINFENVNTGATASTDYVATSAGGSDTNHYINMGITSPNWDGTQENSLTTSLSANDGYLYVQGDITSPGSGGNLVVGTSTAGTAVKVIVGGNTASNISAVFNSPNTPSTSVTTGALVVTGGVGIDGNLNVANLSVTQNFATSGNIKIDSTAPSTNTTTGALQVAGGVGIGGNLNVGEDVVITGNLTVNGSTTTLNTQTLDVEDLQITVAKGALDSAAANGAGLLVDGALASITYAHSTSSWNFNKAIRGSTIALTDTTDTTNESSGALQVAGGVAIAKDLFVGGGDIITDETTFNLINTTATTLNVGGAATALNLGASTGTLTLNNPTVIGASATQNLYNTVATTLNFAGATTTLTIGATTGTANIRNATTNILGNANVSGTLNVTGDSTLTGDLAINGADLTTTATTFNLLDTTATTVNFAGAATALYVGADTGTVNLMNANIWAPNATTLDGAQTTISLFTQNAVTVDAFKSATDIEIGATTGTVIINNPAVVGSQATQDLYNTNATTLNFAGAAAALTIGGVTGTASLRNANIWLPNATTLDGAQTNLDLFTQTVTTANVLTKATDLEFGANTGTVTINNPTVVGTQSTANLWNSTATTVNFAGSATSLVIGATSGTTELRNANIYLPYAATIYTALPSLTFANVNTTAVNAFGAATELNFAASTGTTTIRNNLSSLGIVYANSATDSTTTTTGGLVVAGGAGIAGNLNVGGLTNIANLTISSATISTSPTTGALTVAGGVGLGANLNINNGATINSAQTDEGLRVYGSVATTLIYANAASNSVTIGGSDDTSNDGVTLKIASNDTMLLPIGTTAERPGNNGNVDLTGMLRYNTSLNYPEYYDGSQWKSAGADTTFTIITSEQFNGDGANVTYELSASATTNSTMVAINGIVQIPILAYDISGTTLTFTEAPAEGDIIEVRKFTTTQTVTNVSSQNGYSSFAPSNVQGSAIYSGNSTPNIKLRVAAKPDGTWAYQNGTKTTYDQTATNIPSSGTPVVVDSFSASTYSTAKYVVQAKNGTSITSIEVMVVTDGTNAYIDTGTTVSSGSALGTVSANVVSGDVRLYYTSTSLSNSNVKVYTTYIV